MLSITCDIGFIEALRKRKKNTVGQHSLWQWPKCDSWHFLESVTSNCVCRIFPHLQDGSLVGQIWAARILTPQAFSWQACDDDITLVFIMTKYM